MRVKVKTFLGGNRELISFSSPTSKQNVVPRKILRELQKISLCISFLKKRDARFSQNQRKKLNSLKAKDVEKAVSHVVYNQKVDIFYQQPVLLSLRLAIISHRQLWFCVYVMETRLKRQNTNENFGGTVFRETVYRKPSAVPVRYSMRFLLDGTV